MNLVAVVKRSLYKKISFIVINILLLALILIGAAIYTQEMRDKRAVLLDELRFSSELIASRAVAAMIFHDYDAVNVNIRSARFLPSVIDVCVYDQELKKVAQYNNPHQLGTEDTFSVAISSKTIDSKTINSEANAAPSAACPVILEAEQLQTHTFIDDHIAWSITPISNKYETVGYLKIVSHTRNVVSDIHHALTVITAILVAGMFLAFALGSKLLRTTLHPLNQLTADVKRIANDPFSDFRPQKHQDDEVGDLVDSFSHMLDVLSQENLALQASEKRFRALADNSPVGIYLKSPTGELKYANDKWFEITGFDQTDINKQQSQELFTQFIDDIDLPQYKKMLRTVLDKQQPCMVEYSYQPASAPCPMRLLEYLAPVTNTTNAATETKTLNTTGVIGSVLDVTELKHAQMELEKLAYYDALTGLSNRRFFQDHLKLTIARAAKKSQTFSLLMIDLDDFKRINDSIGHDAGDYLLQALGERLQDCFFKEDVIARLGGDEFIVLLNSADSDVIESAGHRIQEAINTPVEFQGRILETRCSIGVACYPQDADNARDLMKNADIALYQAKSSGRNCLMLFSSEMNQIIQEHVALEYKIQHALKHNQFSLHLQPQVNAAIGQPVWSEALLRWFDDEEGFISPARFIPVAEASGLIIDIGDWVLKETCRLWSLHGDQLTSIGIKGISVNLSPRQFYAANLVKNTLQVLQDHHVAPEHIAFEITESLVMEDIQIAMDTMRELRSSGFRLSIDDFGTGYSSLSYLKQFTIDYLKIDKSFIDGLPEDQNDAAITGAIIAMAWQLGIKIVAEGIETEQQRDYLLEQNCSSMQGYLFSKPAPVEELLQRFPVIEQPRKVSVN